MSSTKKDDRPDNGVHNVVVKSINDNATTTYELDSKYDTMRTLMIKIYNKKGIPTVKQKLFYKGIRCDQMAGSIAALDIKPNSEMELIVEESSGAAFAGIQGQGTPASSGQFRLDIRVVVPRVPNDNNPEHIRTFPIQVSSMDTVRQVKLKIQTAIGMPVHQQWLRWYIWTQENGIHRLVRDRMNDDNQLHVYGLRHASCLELTDSKYDPESRRDLGPAGQGPLGPYRP